MKLSLLLSVLFAFPAFAWADPFVCFTDAPKMVSEFDLRTDPLPIELASMPACRTMRGLAMGLTATALTLTSAGIYTACTGVGAPAAITLEGGAVAAQTISLVVGMLPCDNSSDKEMIKELARQVVCVELEKVGVTCQL